MDNRMVIFISSPDAYADVFKVFLFCLHKNWPDCPYEIVLATNNGHYEGVTVLNNSKTNDGWIDRAIPALSEIDSEYVLLMCDDCLITKKVRNDLIEAVLNDMDEHKLDFVGFSNHIKGKKLHRDAYVNIVRKNSAYALNLQSGIFRKSFLMEILGTGENSPWELENQWLAAASKADRSYFTNIGSLNMDILGIRNGVLKGTWYYHVVEELKAQGLDIQTDRRVMTRVGEKKYLLGSKIGKMMPSRLRPAAKWVLKHFGLSFTTDY